MVKLCFDYGHGGKDSGAIYKGRFESHDNLNIGKKVANKLRPYGFIIDETRTEDKTISLEERVKFANKKDYDYFISFHRNAFKPEVATGVETYIYLNKNRKALYLAGMIQDGLAKIGFVDRGVKLANFYVLRKTKAPALLIEIGFIDNSLDNRLFDEKKEKIVDAIKEAIINMV